jgi:hypothetical protein
VVAFLAIAMAGATDLAAQSASEASREQLTLRSYDGPTMPAEAVRVTVPERRTGPTRTITVAAVRIPTSAQHPGRPIVW